MELFANITNTFKAERVIKKQVPKTGIFCIDDNVASVLLDFIMTNTDSTMYSFWLLKHLIKQIKPLAML